MFGSTTGGFGGFGQQSPSQPANPFGAPAQPAANPFGQPASTFGAAPASSFGGAFGQAQAAPAFGAAQPAPAFGAPTFGQAAKPSFGGFGSSAPAFGATSAPSFAAPAGQPFGAAPATGGFGASGFGAAPAPAFGAASAPSLFGAAPAPAFGAAAPAPAFGATNAFGAAPATNAFGAAPASPFGGGGGGGLFGNAAATSPPSPFGAPAPAGGLFGAPAGGFGQPQQGGFGAPAAASGGFGQPQQQQAVGTRQVAYAKTQDKEGGTNGVGGTMTTLISISAMPAYNSKTQDELRWEDYQQGVKSSAAGPPPPAQSNVFGAPSFGTPGAASAPTFGGSPGGFGAAASGAFGAAPAPAFGAAPAPAFGAAPAPAFGAAPAPAFGAASAPAFGTSAFGAAPSAGGGLFGSLSPPTFGATSAPAFGGSAFGASAPAFGQSQPATGLFGAPPASSSPNSFGSNTFGAPAPAAASTGGLFGFNSAPSLFSNQAAPAAGGGLFGTTAAAPAAGGGLFGQQPASPPLFGQAPASSAGGGLFSTTPAFGGGGMFGAPQAAASKPSFSFNTSPAAAPAPAFGGGGAFGFNSAPGSSPGLFGATSSPSFAPAATGGLFGFNSSPSLFPGAAGTTNSFQLGGNQQQQLVPAAPSVGQTPYGVFPSLPVVAEPKVGISARPVKSNLPPGATAGTSLVGGGSYRGSPLLSIRSTTTQGLPTPGAGAGAGAGRSNLYYPSQPQGMSYGGLSLIPASSSGEYLSAGGAIGGGGGTSMAPAVLPARANPHRLFIREPPPSIEAVSATPSVFTPSRPRSGCADDSASRQPSSPDVTTRASAQRYHEPVANHQPGSSLSSFLPRLGPRLATLGYSFEPPSNQLEAMLKSDPARGLKAVCNFTVIRKGVGQVRWLKPVDITSLDLERIVCIEEGEVCCYMDEDKPPVGQGLNTDAEITLFNVYKVDKETQQPVKEGPAVLKWEKALRAMCGKMGAKFVFYKPDGGVWKFEVEHFSRYGLVNVDEDEDEDDDSIMDAAQRKALAASKGVAAALRGQPPLPPTPIPHPPAADGGGARYGLGGLDEEMDQGVDNDNEVEEEYSLAPPGQTGLPGHQGITRQQSNSSPLRTIQEDQFAVTAGGGLDSFAFHPAPPLQHSFPTQLNIDPVRMMAMSQSFLSVGGGGGGGGASTLFGAPPPSQPWADPTRRVAPVHVWRNKGPGTLTAGTPPQGPSLVSSLEGLRTLVDREPPAAALSPLTRPSGSSRMADHLHTADVTSSACYTDAGLLLGSSFRVGWGPGGVMAYPSNLGPSNLGPSNLGPSNLGPSNLGPSASCVVRASKVSLEGTVLAFSHPDQNVGLQESSLDALRRRLRASLEVHLEHSSLDPSSKQRLESSSTPVAPKWSLECNAKTLPSVVSSFTSYADKEAACLSDPSAVKGQVATMTAAVLRHESESWRLIDALYGWIEGEDDSEVAPLRDENENDDAMDEGIVAGVAGESKSVLAGFKRRAAITRWLRRQSLVLVESELSPSSLTPLDPSEAVLRLACANQANAAAAIAAAAGDVHLATLLTQAGGGALRTECRKEIAEQIAIWSQNDIVSSIQKDRLLTYRLLAGQVDEARDHLALDWRRYLSLLLVYTSSPSASPSEAIRKLQQSSLTPSVSFPRPSPTYSDPKSHSLFNRDSSPASLSLAKSISQYHPSATDFHYELLCLWAGQQVEGAEGLGCDALSSLLQPAASSPNPLDATRPWRFMTALQAIHALPSLSVAASMSLEAQSIDNSTSFSLDHVLLQVQLEAISQLRLAGGLCEWAVYVALHLPDIIPSCPSSLSHGSDDQPSGGAVRTRLVREILVEGCQEWVRDQGKRSFLLGVLGIPPCLLAEAEAIWAGSVKDELAQLDALILSGQMKEALDLFSGSVGLALFLQLPSPAAEERLDGFLAGLRQHDAIAAVLSSYLDLLRVPGTIEEEQVTECLSHLEAANDRLSFAQDKQKTALVLGRITRQLYQRFCAMSSPSALLQRMLGLKSLPSDLCLAIDSSI